MIKFRILKEQPLVVMCFEGDVTPEHVMSFIEGLVQNPDYDPGYKSIVDLSTCTLLYDVDGMKRTLEFMVTARGFAAKRKTAYITSSAGHVVPPLMMTTRMYNFPMDVKVHSTVESALRWLELDNFTTEDYQRLLNSMCDGLHS